MNTLLKVACVALMVFFVPVGARAEEYPVEVGWIPLLANPKQYDGKKIAITGWMTVYLTKDTAIFTLFMSQEAVTCTDLTLGLGVDSNSVEKFLAKPNETWQLFNHERVRLEGVFRAIDWGKEPPGVPGKIESVEAFRQAKPGAPMFNLKR